uniref:Uncharacterized protein n=1 Tax=Bombyx mori TaxID=7091 RepID=A0A8R2R666_BOMMO|nr:uncharacterized protein LOC101736719 isoform X1 [Bombyx mori]
MVCGGVRGSNADHDGAISPSLHVQKAKNSGARRYNWNALVHLLFYELYSRQRYLIFAGSLYSIIGTCYQAVLMFRISCVGNMAFSNNSLVEIRIHKSRCNLPSFMTIGLVFRTKLTKIGRIESKMSLSSLESRGFGRNWQEKIFLRAEAATE